MAISVTPLLTTADEANVSGNWTSNETIGTEAEINVQGAACLTAIIRNQTSYAYAGISSTNMAGQHIYLWFQTIAGPYLDIEANGGIQLAIWDSTGNWGSWYVGGRDTYGGGWKCFVANCDAPYSEISGGPNKADIVGVGWRCTVGGASNKTNTFWDVVRFGSGLKVTGGSDTSSFTLEEIYQDDLDSNNRYGIIDKRSGIYFLQGELEFGDRGGNEDCYFADSGKTIQFENAFVSSSLYKISVVGNADTTTNFQFGTKAGSAGVSGCFISAPDGYNWIFDATDSSADEMKLYGTTFKNASNILFPTTSSGKESLNCSFLQCEDFYPNTMKFENFVVSDATNGIYITSVNHKVRKGSIINCTDAVHIINAGTYDFTNVIFINDSTDIKNESGGTVYINALSGSNPTTETGDTTIYNSKSVLFTGLKNNTEVRIYRKSDDSYLGGVEDSSSSFQYTYNYVGDETVYVNFINTSYEWTNIETLILGDTNQSLPIQQRYDRNYSNP